MLPSEIASGVVFTITNLSRADANVFVYSVEDRIPSGWTAGNVSHGGRIDAMNAKVKWGPFFDNAPRVLTYQAAAPPAATGLFQFTGTGSFDGVGISISGASQIRVTAGVGSGSEVVSQLAASYEAASVLSVTNKVRLDDKTQVYSVEETLPSGWTASQLNHGGVFDSANRKVKWGPFSDRIARDLIYQLRPAAGQDGISLSIFGVASFDGLPVPVTGHRESRAAVSSAVRLLPDFFGPLERFAISITASPTRGIRVLAVQETIPAGWSITNISHSGQLSTVNPEASIIRWGPFFTTNTMTLSYEVIPPASATDLAQFNGEASFDGMAVPVSGSLSVRSLRSRAARLLPAQFIPGISFAITNRISLDAATTVYALEEQPPAGWQISGINEGGSYDPATGRIKWGPFSDRVARDLSYSLQPPLGIDGAFTFRGEASFDGRAVATSGLAEISAVPVSAFNKIVRSMPETLREGRSVVISNSVSAGDSVSVYAVEEQIPPGWTVSEISHGGQSSTLPAPLGTALKWGPFLDNEARVLTYLATPPRGGNGPQLFDGLGSFNSVPVRTTGSSNVLVIPNQTPLARPDVFERERDQGLSFSTALILVNDSDANNDPLAVMQVTQPLSGQATTSLAGGTITYAPAAGFNGPDSFTYAVTDGYGGSSSATIAISIAGAADGLNITKIERLESGAIRLHFAGIPNRTYDIQATDSLNAPNWISLGARTASIRGEFEFEDSTAIGQATRFYRTRQP